MSLKNLTSEGAARPAGIECEDWQAEKPGSKRCIHFIANGSCGLEEHFVCVEWTQANFGFRSLLESQDRREGLTRLEGLIAAAAKKPAETITAPKPSDALAALRALKGT